MINERYESMLDWVQSLFPLVTPANITPASSDASFRQYFRVRHEHTSHIVMDAPPDKEDCRPFIAVSNALCELGLQAPRVLETDLDKGFLLLSDLGSRQYLAELHEASVEPLYGDALDALGHLQLGGDPDTELLPPYNAELLEREMELFREWFLGRHLGLELKDAEHKVLDRTFACLRDSALEQPRVWVHRDYHSRNLMVTERDNPGILDFQDAVVGAVTYDLVSLLRDCYIAWPRERVESWALIYRDRLQAQGMAGVGDDGQFLRWFDLMGVQRHLKAIGIFARLNSRDGKPGYLRDIPRTLGYVLDVAGRYDDLADLRRLIEEREIPARLLS